jgi:hypothetical protein
MRRRALGLAALLSVLALGPADAANRARPLTISDRQVASFHYRVDGSFKAAVAALGLPSRISPQKPRGDCIARWAKLELKIRFYTLGITGDACGSFGSAETTSVRFRTGKGARIGTTLQTLWRLYPRARLHRGPAFAGAGAWWLVIRTYSVGPFSYPGLYARVRNGRVWALGASYPSGGD